MEKINAGIFIDFDGVISKSSVRVTINFLHEYINSIKPISYEFIENYVKSVLCFPVDESVTLLFNSLGIENKLEHFYLKFKKLDSDRAKIIIEQSFYDFIKFCNEKKIEYRFLSLASVDRLRLIKDLDMTKILKLGHSKANPKTYLLALNSLKEYRLRWFQLDDSPLALRAGKLSGLKTIMMINDVFTTDDYKSSREFIDYKITSFSDAKKILI